MQLTDEQIEKLRQSGIRLDADGRFWHEGGEVAHHGLRAAFWRWLDRNPDGRYVLRLDAQRFVYLDVDDTPFVVRSMRWEGDRALARLSDDTEEELALSTVFLRPDGRAQLRVKQRFDAVLSSAAWNVLSTHLTAHDGSVYLGPHRLGPLEGQDPRS